jgi:hypothetical protein
LGFTHGTSDTVRLKVRLERVARERVTVNAADAVSLHQRGELRDGMARVERWTTTLLLDAIDHHHPTLRVGNGNSSIVARATTHIHEGSVLAPFLRRQRMASRDNAGKNLRLVERGALRCTWKVEMQATIARAR